MNMPTTSKLLKSQHPSWNIATAVFLASITVKTKKWKTARTKLIRIIADVPIHAVVPPLTSGHCKKLGSMSTKCLIVYKRITEMSAHTNWKITKPILA